MGFKDLAGYKNVKFVLLLVAGLITRLPYTTRRSRLVDKIIVATEI